MIWKPHLAVNKKTLGTLVPRHHGDMSYNIVKAGRSSKDGLDMESRTPAWKALFTWSSARELARIRPCKFWHFDMFTWGGRGSGRIEVFNNMLSGAPLLPSRRFSLTHVFAALVLLSLLVPFFLSSRLTESLAQTTVNLNQKSRIPHCNLIWIDSKIETYKIA